MTVLLTNQFNRHEDTVPSNYAMVFVVAAALAVVAIIAAAFLPMESAGKYDAAQSI